MGKRLGKAPAVLRAYRHAVQERCGKTTSPRRQASLLASPAPKVLLAGQPHSRCLYRFPLTRMIQQQGGVPAFADRFDPAA